MSDKLDEIIDTIDGYKSKEKGFDENYFTRSSVERALREIQFSYLELDSDGRKTLLESLFKRINYEIFTGLSSTAVMEFDPAILSLHNICRNLCLHEQSRDDLINNIYEFYKNEDWRARAVCAFVMRGNFSEFSSMSSEGREKLFNILDELANDENWRVRYLSVSLLSWVLYYLKNNAERIKKNSDSLKKNIKKLKDSSALSVHKILKVHDDRLEEFIDESLIHRAENLFFKLIKDEQVEIRKACIFILREVAAIYQYLEESNKNELIKILCDYSSVDDMAVKQAYISAIEELLNSYNELSNYFRKNLFNVLCMYLENDENETIRLCSVSALRESISFFKDMDQDLRSLLLRSLIRAVKDKSSAVMHKSILDLGHIAKFYPEMSKESRLELIDCLFNVLKIECIDVADHINHTNIINASQDVIEFIATTFPELDEDGRNDLLNNLIGRIK